MSIEKKLTDFEIKRILVVDDRPEHILAAKEAFSKYTLATIDYTSSASDAIEKIKSAEKEGKKYDLIISDLEMETKTAGLDVVKEALLQFSYTTIATGKSYEKADSDPHGPSTTVVPSMESIKGRKDKPEVWKEVLEKTLDYISDSKTQTLYRSEKRYRDAIGKPSELFMQYLIDEYKGG